MQGCSLVCAPWTRYSALALHGVPLEEAVAKAKTIKNVLGVVQLGRDGPFALRARRESMSEIRKVALPQSINLQEGTMQADAKMWTLKNVRASTTCQSLTKALKSLGWAADIIRPVGKDSWLASAADDPPATHLCIGQDYVAVIPMVKQSQANVNLVVPKPNSSANFSMCPDEPDDVSTTNARLSDMKADLEDALTHKLSGMLNDRLKTYDQKMTQLSETVEHVQQEVTATATTTQQKLQEQHNALQNQLASNNNTIMTQMQSLFSKMQADLQATLNPEGVTENDPKRTRTS